MEDRYHRHHLLTEIGIEGQQRIRNASVLLVGVGGLGSPIALYLTAAGVGRIGLVDNDTVSLTNLQRQILYREHQLDKPKTACARETLQALNSQAVIDIYPERLTKDNIEEIASSYDLIIDGCDNHATRYLIDDYCAGTKKPYIYGSIGEFHGQVSVFHYANAGSYAALYPDREHLEGNPQTILGVMGVVPGIVGTIQAAEAVKIITGAGQPLAGRLLLIDVLTMQMQTIKL